MAKGIVAVKFVGDVRSFMQSIDKVDKKMGTTGGKFAKFGKVAAAGFAAAGVAAFAFGKSSVDAFVESEQAQAQLDDAFERFPRLAKGNVEALRDLNSELAKKTRFDDDATASAQAVLAQFGLTQDQLETLTPLMQDFAAKTGTDLPTAAGQLGKAVLGQGRALKSVGINFVDTKNAALNLAQITNGLHEQVGGFAEEEGKTAAGQAEILKNQFGELQERIGQALMPVLLKLADILSGTVIPAIEDAVTWLGEHKEAAVALAAIVGGALVLAMTAYAVAAWNAATATIAATWPFLLFVAAVAALTYALYQLTNNEGEGFLDWLQRVGNTISKATQRVFKFFQGVWDWGVRVLSIVKQVISAITRLTGVPVPTSIPVPGLGPIRVPRFDDGGVMPGRKGVHSLAMVAGGETILPTHKAASMSTGDNITINVTAEHEPVAAAVVRELRRRKLMLAGA